MYIYACSKKNIQKISCFLQKKFDGKSTSFFARIAYNSSKNAVSEKSTCSLIYLWYTETHAEIAKNRVFLYCF